MQAYRQLCALAGRTLDKKVLWEHTVWATHRSRGRLQPRFTFAFTRDPYRRVEAVYRHKVVQPRERGKRWSPLFAIYGRKVRLGMPFDEFVAAVAEIPDRRAEKHFRSQSWFLFDGDEPIVDFIGRIEEFERDWAEVCARSKFEPIETAYNVSPKDVSVEWTDALRELVAKRYAEDFERLGYEK